MSLSSVSPASSRPARSNTLPALLGVVVIALAVLLAVMVAAGGLDALKAAGLVGTAPTQGAGVFTQLIATLESNEKWLMFTGFGLAGTTVALLFFLGSMRAPDILFKLLVGVAIILIGLPALLA
jgi:hypothetical protein